jgi:mannose-6-phosphate isomerase-like protein (cupin superfamily)
VTRESFLGDEPWDVVREEMQVRTRVFARQVDDVLSASLLELLPGSPGDRLHMHYGIEEMFFVLSGTPILRNGQTEEQLAPGDVVHCQPARILAVSSRHFPDVLVYPEQGIAWVATRNPDFPAPDEGDPGMIARFELPADE